MWWTSLAIAGPGQSGTLFPGARDAPDMVWASVGGIVGNVEGKGISGGPAADLGFSRGRWMLHAHAHRWAIRDGVHSGVFGVAGRFQAVDTEGFDLAFVLGAGWVPEGRAHLAPGVAMQAKVGRISWIDVTLMPYSLGYRLGSRTWTDVAPRGRWALPWGDANRWTHGGILPLASIGYSFQVPPLGADNRVRFGFPEFIAWHHVSERVFFDIGGVLVGATLGVHGRLGFRFPKGESQSKLLPVPGE